MLPANVLLVENGNAMGQSIASMLMDLGYGVRLFENAEKGLETFAKRSFELVMANAHLPDLDGIGMVRQMRTSDPTLATIILTSQQDHKAALGAAECGIKHFLTKPFSAEQLKEKLEEALWERDQAIEHRTLVSELFRMSSVLQEKVIAQGRELTHTESYLYNLLDAAPFSILSTDIEGHILTFNRTAQRTYQYDEEEIVGKSVSLLFGEKQGSSKEERGSHQRKDGMIFSVLVWRRDVVDSQERHVARLYVVEDLSERECLEGQLLYAERLSVLGQMAPRIAHEFKSPLQIITGYAELVTEYLNKNDVKQGLQAANAIIPAAEKLVELVQQISNLGKPKQSQLEEMDLGEEIDQILHPMQELGVIKHCEIKKNFPPLLPKIKGDLTQIEQVFRNLIINAIHAMEESAEKRLTLTLGLSSDGCRVEFAIGDTGQGIAHGNLEKIFQPFFTTKPQGEGTGLGMPIVKSILDRHEASIEVESEVGRGTWFYLSFPAVSVVTCDA
jgi:two-component system, NtrC family, sensor kinase